MHCQTVNIDQTAAAGRTVLVTAAAGKTTFLHELVVFFDASEKVTIVSDNGAGTDEIVLATLYPAANGGAVIPWKADQGGCLRTASANRNLCIKTTAAKAYGYAVYSQNV